MSHIFQINLSNGGVPKLPVASASLTTLGLDGDVQDNTKNHGGPDRAVCLYGLEQILALQAEGNPIVPGATGETVTVSGLDWDALSPGVKIRLGPNVEIELTDYTAPCSKIAAAFSDGKYGRISQKTHPGWSRWYARVLTPGLLTVGAEVSIFE